MRTKQRLSPKPSPSRFNPTMPYTAYRGDLPESEVAVIIPAFNEGNVIAGVIKNIQEASDFPIFVVDDSSTDNTAAVAQQAGATVIPLSVQLGAWGATQTGLRYALRRGYEFVICMDADGQHDAKSLPELLSPVTTSCADVTIGCCPRRGSVLRKIAWVLLKRASGLSLEDVTSGFRAYNKKVMQSLATWQATLLNYQDVGVLLLLQSHDFKIVDIAVGMQPRRNGKSRIFGSWLTVIYYMCYTLLLGVSKRKLTHRFESSGI